MPFAGRFLVCSCGRPVPAVTIVEGLVCAGCSRDLFLFMWEEREREMVEDAAKPRGKGRPPKKRYYR